MNRVEGSLFFLVWAGMLVYIAYMSRARHDWFLVAWCGFILALPVYALLASLARTRAMRRFAAEHGLIFLGDTLPAGLLIARTSFAAKSYSTSACVCGEIQGSRIAVFDLSHRRGKGTRTQTVVALPRRGSNAIPEPPIDDIGSFEFEGAGEWIIGYVSGRRVATVELPDWCVELHTLARDLLAQTNGAAESGPRLFRWMT